MKDQGIPTFCAWHPMWHGTEYQISGRPPHKGEMVSHGMCRKCAKRFRQESRGRIG